MGGDKTICPDPHTDDAELEGNETFRVVLSGATGASLGSPAEATVEILDDEIDQGPCVPGEGVLCLADAASGSPSAGGERRDLRGSR